jgi:hypothetical protein
VVSIYKRGKVLWISYQTSDGKWRDRSTGYRSTDADKRKRAQRLVEAQSRKERERRITYTPTNWDWVDSWLIAEWSGSTGKRYGMAWRNIRRWLTETNLAGPQSLRREHLERFTPDRMKSGAARNSAAYELKFLRRVLGEAVQREYIPSNPATGIRIRREATKEKRPWTEAELAIVDAELIRLDRFGWMRTTFLLGRYQAARVASCALPLDAIDFDRKVIHWPPEVMKGAKPLTQPVDGRLLPDLREIAEHRRAAGHATLCDLPVLPSLEWRKFLDRLGIKGASHHGLRVTWITKAAMSGIPESIAMRFSGHSSQSVHRIYQRFGSDDVAEMLERLKG